MSLHVVNNISLQNSDLTYLVHMIYINSEHLSKIPNLKHTKIEILKLLKSEKSQVYFYILNKKIVAYLIGEIITLLNDNRKVFYISYLFTSKHFRNMGFASKLINVSENKVKIDNLNGIMLTCDTENNNVYDFYTKKGFMPDLILKNYSRYEILFK